MVYLANTGRVFGPRGSLEQAGGDGRWAFLDHLPEAGGVMSGRWIRSLAFFPRRQVELLGCPAGEEGRRRVTHGATGTGMLHTRLTFTRNRCCFNTDTDAFTWLKGTWRRCWRWSPLWICEGSLSWSVRSRRRRSSVLHHLRPARGGSSL